MKSECILHINGAKIWRQQGKLHREDGPAVERLNGTKEWWIRGVRYHTPEDWARAILQHQGMECTEESINECVRTALQPYMKIAL